MGAMQAEMQGLLEAIVSGRADVLDRLVYADWLEEQGRSPERVASIRRPERVMLGKHLPGGDDVLWPDGEGLQPGDSALYCILNALMLGPYGGYLPCERLVFRHGFLSEVRLPWASWRRCGRGLARGQPLERVEVSDKRPHHADGSQPGMLAGWTWFVGDASAAASPHHVTNAVWRKMCRTWFTHEEDAVSAFSEALIALAREELATPAA